MKYFLMKLFMLTLVTGVFASFQRKSGVGKDGTICENNSKLIAPPAEIIVHLGNIVALESFRHQYPFGWGLRVEFITYPGFVDVICLLELVDNALADIAEGSDIIGEYLYLYCHLQKSYRYCLSSLFKKIYLHPLEIRIEMNHVFIYLING
jgi:hypothetical protein